MIKRFESCVENKPQTLQKLLRLDSLCSKISVCFPRRQAWRSDTPWAKTRRIWITPSICVDICIDACIRSHFGSSRFCSSRLPTCHACLCSHCSWVSGAIMFTVIAYFSVGIVIGAFGHEKIFPCYERLLSTAHTHYKEKVLIHKEEQ